MAQPPRPFLTEEQMRALSDQERAIAIAEWSSYNARLRREHEQQAVRGTYRGGRGRGARGRGRGFVPNHSYQPYARAPYSRGQFHNVSATFSHSATASAPSSSSDSTPKIAHLNQLAKTSEQLTDQRTATKSPCPSFTATGVCKRPRCPLVHDPDKTAICRLFLSKGDCPKGDSCPLSHEPSAKRSPACIHFQNGHCNNDRCRYAHVESDEDDPVCDSFARLGFCEQGEKCPQRHAFECPDFSNKGSCDNDKCRLPHIIHAGRLRRARKSSSEGVEPASAGNSAQNPVVLDTVDYDHALTQQADFVPLGA